MANARKKTTFKDTFIREVNVHYRKTANEPVNIKSAGDISQFVRSVLIDNSREHLVALYLDGAHNVASYSIVSIGTANSAHVTPREIFQRAVLVGAIAIVIAHNHPSGSTTPSNEDRSITKRISEAGNVLGIKLLDHVIVTDSHFVSFLEEGFM